MMIKRKLTLLFILMTHIVMPSESMFNRMWQASWKGLESTVSFLGSQFVERSERMLLTIGAMITIPFGIKAYFSEQNSSKEPKNFFNQQSIAGSTESTVTDLTANDFDMIADIAAIEKDNDFDMIDDECAIVMDAWIARCENLFKNRAGANFRIDSAFDVFGSKEERWKQFKNVLERWMKLQATGPLANEQNWMIANNGKTKPDALFFDTTVSRGVFIPFAQKLIVQPGQELILRGDLHGDIASLIKQIRDLQQDGTLDNNFKIQNGQKIIFLGDYVDRGQYGAEVLYTMMQLALINPGQVIFVRGNHEDLGVSAAYGFKEEIKYKFEDILGDKHAYISRMNDFLPVVLYIGCTDKQTGLTHYIQCCHGGVEQGYNPKVFLDDHTKQFQMIGILNRRQSVQEIVHKDGINTEIKRALSFLGSDLVMKDGINLRTPADNGLTLGLMWNDFDVENSQQLKHLSGRGLEYGKELTEEVLLQQSSDKSKLRGIMRAHQHSADRANPMMKGLVASKGVYKLWKQFETGVTRRLDDGVVWTFNVSPDSVYGESVGFDFDVRAHITAQEKYEEWNMVVKNCSPF